MAELIMGYEQAELEELDQDKLDSLLLGAVEMGDLDLVKKLHENFANIHTQWNSPLKQAVLEGHDDIARWLLDEGVDVDRDSVRYAAERGNLELVKDFCDKDPDSITDWYLASATAKAGQVEILRFLHEKGVPLRGEDDFTVGCAAEGGDLATLKFYVEELGANVKARDGRAFTEAVKNGHTEAADYIIERQGGKLTKHDRASIHWAR